MQTKEKELNELIRQVIQACAQCRNGRATMECKRNLSQCHNRKVRGWLKQIDRINKEAITK